MHSRRVNSRIRDMDPEVPRTPWRVDRAPAARTFWSIILLSSFLVGCSHNSESRIHIELQDVPETTKTLNASPSAPTFVCPPGDLSDVDSANSPSGGHTVKLSWNTSTSAIGPNAKNIQYCLYRTKGQPVQKSNPPGKIEPCVNCQRLSKDPSPSTSTSDTKVENDAHYCYIAVAVDIQTRKMSVFSNQADAIVPPNKDGSFCNPSSKSDSRSPRRRQR